MKDYEIIGVEFHDNDNIENREVVVTLDNGTEVHIVRCYESWEQFGGTTDELSCTVDIADCVNDWLHGDDELPTEVYDYIYKEEDEEDEDGETAVANLSIELYKDGKMFCGYIGDDCGGSGISVRESTAKECADAISRYIRDYFGDEFPELPNNIELLKQQIIGAHDFFVEKNGHEPLFAQVYVRWDDDCDEEEYSNVTIKLNSEYVMEEDSDITYYADGFDELMSLCNYDNHNLSDFVVVGFEEFRDEL